MRTKSRVLVTGGSGFIGGHFINLIKDDYDITNYDLVVGRDIRSAMPHGNFDFIVHFAALRSVTDSETDPKPYIETNCWGTVNLLRVYHRGRFINISSSAANEVRSVYGATKQFGEGLVNQRENSLNIRLYNVFGEGQKLTSGAVLSNFIMAKKLKTAPIIFGTGEQSRDFTYVHDVVASILEVMQSTETGTVHFGYGNSMSVKDIMSTVFGHVPQFIQRQGRPYEIKDSKSPTCMPVVKYGRAEGLKRTLAWYESHSA